MLAVEPTQIKNTYYDITYLPLLKSEAVKPIFWGHGIDYDLWLSIVDSKLNEFVSYLAVSTSIVFVKSWPNS